MKVVVVTGATGEAGRAVCARFADRGDTVIAVGTDAERLLSVHADDHRVADLTELAAAKALARSVVESHGRVDAVVHLVGGWRGGDSPEADAWLRPRLVDTVDNVIQAFEPELTASDGRLAIVSSTAVKGDGTNSYTRAKADAERLVRDLGDRLDDAGGGATGILAIRSLGEDGTPAAVLAERLVSWIAAPVASSAHFVV
ncbi:SDR family NAD(P)-dependent oxidoreductase [Salinibacterium sp. ZJ70]|uniref:SDR family NAD(P)-dependent oxidoreductase n=1 Tax=Salinibacterium sp. ZJ70 TaxID=2708084 RepID=UPI00141DF6FE|nr:SDR family NAD(P)-dependent oxidoreductase [Salinibacterium sp. ZJ70]